MVKKYCFFCNLGNPFVKAAEIIPSRLKERENTPDLHGAGGPEGGHQRCGSDQPFGGSDGGAH